MTANGHLEDEQRVILFDESTLPDLDHLRAAVQGGAVVVIAGSQSAGVSASGGACDVVQAGDLAVDLGARRARCRGHDVPLTDREVRILHALARRPGRALSFDDLSSAGWGVKTFGHSDTVRSAIKRLRRKLSHAEAGVTIEAVRGFGFRLSGPASGSSTKPRVDWERVER